MGQSILAFKTNAQTIENFLNKCGFLLLNWTDKTKLWIWINESRSFAWFMVVLSWKVCWSWKLGNEIKLFDPKLERLTNTSSFPNVFVHCVVLGWLKPTKLCRMVKIMLQITITLFLDDADVEFVSWCGSIYTRLENYCTNVGEFLHKCGFCCWIEKMRQNFGLKMMNHVHLRGLWWFWVEKFVVHENYAMKCTFLAKSSKFWQKQGHFLTFLFVVLYLANWNRREYVDGSK